jgi:enoyl-CoA hydratase
MSIDILVEHLENAVIVRFTRPELRNPLSSSVLDRLDQLLENLEGPDQTETVVFTGVGEIFASGANVREISALNAIAAPAFALRGQLLMNRIAALSRTTIAAINGYCFGGALDLALACDKRIASRTATFAHPGAGLGIITGWGGTQRLPRLVGRANALEMFFTAQPINAGRALRIGLVDLIADDIFNNELLDLDTS